MITADCLFCIDGRMPAGRDRYMGELFELCPVCHFSCGRCDGIAVYAASYRTLAALAAALLPLRLAPVICPGCLGVTALIPFDLLGGSL